MNVFPPRERRENTSRPPRPVAIFVKDRIWSFLDASQNSCSFVVVIFNTLGVKPGDKTKITHSTSTVSTRVCDFPREHT